MIRRVIKYKVGDKEFCSINEAERQAEENLAAVLRPLVYDGQYNPSDCMRRIMSSIVSDPDKYICLNDDNDD